MKNIKIVWLTSSFLIDVDIPIVPRLQKFYDIDWIILTTSSNRDGDIELVERTGCCKYQIIETNDIFFHPKKFIVYKKLLKDIKSKGYDLFYFDFLGMPYFMPLAQMMLPKDRCIIAAHNVKTPKGARYYWMAKPYMEYVNRAFCRFQVFSKNQYDLLRSINKNAQILYAPLCLKNYGNPTIEKPYSPITFLFFGNIVEYKRVDILLKAVNILCEKGISGFKVIIKGYCRPNKWQEMYLPLIKYPDFVETDIRRIPNELIPNLFQESHYFVMPYQDIAQSGAMTVALQYNLPIIASNLEVFKEFMNGENDGFFFESGSADLLAETMKLAIEKHEDHYEQMRLNQARFVKETLSTEAIVQKYKQYLDEICQD